MDAIVIAIIGLVGVVAGSVITNLFLRDKISSEADKTSSDAWQGFANKMESRVEKLEVITEKQEKKITRYGNRVIYLTKGIEVLIHQIIQDGKNPCWVPDEWNPDCEDK